MDPRIILFLLLIGFPLLELYLLIELGAVIGGIWTIFLIVFTGVFGALLMRQQGTSHLMRMRKAMEQGEIPAVAMFEGVFVFAAAFLLLVPGLITDGFGVLLLISPLRRLLVRRILGLQHFQPPGGQGGPGAGTGSGPDPRVRPDGIIEGECKVEDENK